MRLVVWIKGDRGAHCFDAVVKAGFSVAALVVQAGGEASWRNSSLRIAEKRSIQVFSPESPRDPEFTQKLTSLSPDLMVLAGYGLILDAQTLNIPPLGCINLHGGKVPEFRGSSPMNWALIKNEPTFTISVLKVTPGIDDGEVLAEQTFDIGPEDKISDLHAKANKYFPVLLVDTLNRFSRGECLGQIQDATNAEYWPRRFPDDGLVLWDRVSVDQAHGRIRALAPPYPCAYTVYKGRKVLLIESMPCRSRFHGEPGRIYQVKENALLVAAQDGALWITKAEFEDTGMPFHAEANRYDRLGTLALAAEKILMGS